LRTFYVRARTLIMAIIIEAISKCQAWGEYIKDSKKEDGNAILLLENFRTILV
jgi:hypothetical protein